MTQGLPKRSDAGRTSTAAEVPPYAASSVLPAQIGTVVTVEWGNEHFQPLAYHGFDTGSVRVSAPVNPGETVAQATFRLWQELNAVAVRVREAKMASYLASVEVVAAKVREPLR